MDRVKRSLVYIKLLQRFKKKKEMTKLLKNFPEHVPDDIAEVIYNILLGNVSITQKDMVKLRKKRESLITIINSRKKKPKLRKEVYKQSGKGLFTILLPILASVIGGVVSNAV